MILSRLELQNFKNFQDKKVKFSPGINVLQGPNGSGKTTILEGIEFALFGSVSRRSGLEPLVKLGESIASASLTFESKENGEKKVFTVFRQISKGETGTSSTRTVLTRDGIEVSSRKAAVDDEILKIVGIGHISYGNSCYIRQGEIRALLEAGKEREREIDRMIGLGVFEDAWKDLRRKESDLEKQVALAKEELIRAQTEVENLSSISKDLSERMEEKIKIEKEVQEAEERLGDLAGIDVPGGPTGEYLRLERAKAAQIQKIQSLEDQLAQIEERIEATNDKLLEMESELIRRENRIESLKDERTSLQDRIRKMEDEIEKGRKTINEMEREVLRLEAELDMEKDLVKTFSQIEVRGDLRCPICGSELTPEHARKTRRSLDGKIRELQEAVERKRLDLRRLGKSGGSLSSRAERLRSQLFDVEKEISEAEAENAGVRISKEEIDGETGSVLELKRGVEKELENEKAALQELERSADKRSPDMGMDEQLAESRGKYLAGKQILERLEKEIPELMEKLAEQQMKKTNLKLAEEKHSDLNRQLERIRDIRWAFNNIGPYARQRILSSVSERTGELFSRIYSGGMISGVTLTQDYDVRAEMATGVQLASRLLSVGERVVAGLALRIALAQVWQRSTGAAEDRSEPVPGFLILDEPTEYLDERNVRALARTIAGLKALGQVIIVTHDRELMEEISRKSEINRIVLTRPRIPKG